MANLYTIKRDDICVGKVITDFNLSDKTYNLLGHEIKLGEYTTYRNMLFVKDSDNTVCDLLYGSPHYPIYTPDNIEACIKSRIIVSEAYSLARLLKYYDYTEELTFLDVLNIRNRFFDGKFPIKNASTFGLKELEPSELTYYDNSGHIIVDPRMLKMLIRERKRSQRYGQLPEFVNNDDFDGLTPEQLEKVLLPQEDFKVLIEYGDHSLYSVLGGYEERTNAFKPHKEEGLIRSLKKYN